VKHARPAFRTFKQPAPVPCLNGNLSPSGISPERYSASLPRERIPKFATVHENRLWDGFCS
jgi:hypothetical protein